MFKLRGVIPPMITPFTKEGDLDLKNLRKLVEFLSLHVQGLFICGSYGSGAMMSVEERKRVAETTLKVAAGKTMVIVHTGTTNTRDAVELSLHAKEIGCDAVAAVGPYYFVHSEKDLLGHYTEIIRAVGPDFPVYAYHNPKFQGYEFSLPLMRKLKDAGLHGIKDATFNIITYATYMRELSGDNFDIALGTEAMWLAARVLGCEAFIPGLGNAYPELCVKMWKEGMKNDFDTCRKTQFLINEMRTLMYLAGSTQQAVYCMASLRGIIDSYPRLPFTPSTEEEKASLRMALEKIGVL
jgi:dihydrodipicolinate synthase/N-acetylneuraminate lyase